MDHKALSRHLIAAGILAGVGGVYIFYIHEPLHMLRLFGGCRAQALSIHRQYRADWTAVPRRAGELFQDLRSHR